MKKKNLLLLMWQLVVVFFLVLSAVPVKASVKKQVKLDHNAAVFQDASFLNTLYSGNIILCESNTQISVVENEIAVSVKTAKGSSFLKLTSLHRMIQNQIGFRFFVPQDDRPIIQSVLLYTAAFRI